MTDSTVKLTEIGGEAFIHWRSRWWVVLTMDDSMAELVTADGHRMIRSVNVDTLGREQSQGASRRRGATNTSRCAIGSCMREPGGPGLSELFCPKHMLGVAKAERALSLGTRAP